MKKTFLLRALLILSLPLAFAFSCEDHRQPKPDRFRLKSVTYNDPTTSTEYAALSPSSTFFLKYDAAGRLTGYDLGPNVNSSRWDLQYSQNRVSTLNYFLEVSPFSNTYTYTEQGQLSRIANYRLFNITGSRPPQLEYTFDFIYDGTNTLPSAKRITNELNTQNRVEETYTFANGNAVKINGQTINYDNTPNPYKGLFGLNTFLTLVPYAFGQPFGFSPFSARFADFSVKVFNQNNITNDAVLTYNANGLVSKIAYNDGRSEEFTYEQY